MVMASEPGPIAHEALEAIPGYRLHEAIGRGGSATVYRAEQQGDGFRRPVALKVLDRFPDAKRLRRFDAEKRILAALEHPGIARLYDAGLTSAGRPFLAMELVGGVDLIEHCRRNGAPLRARIDLFVAVLEAVEHAHAASVVHCDLKPGNILVSDLGSPKLLDFGIARLLATEDPTGTAEPPPDDPTETRPAPLTPAYASPEQVAGRPAEPASDLYSLGVVLYELLAGRRPYRLADDRLATLERAILEQEPEPLGLAGDLDAILAKALAKEPAHRFGSAADFAADLKRHLEGRPVLARRPSRLDRLARRIRRRRGGWLRATLAALLLAGLVAQLAGRGAGLFGKPPAKAADPAASPWWALPVAPSARPGFGQGLDALDRGETTVAVAQLRLAAEADPEQPLLAAALATAYARAGHDALARAEGGRALGLAPAEPRESRLLVEAVALQTSGRKAEELDRRRTLWVLAPANFEAGYLLAKSLNESGAPAEAMEVAARLRALPAGRRSPNDLRIGLLEGEALNQLGRPNDAAVQARKIVAEAGRRRLPLLAAHALLIESLAVDGLGQPAQTQAAAEQAQRLFAARGETWGLARALNLQCIAAVRDGRPLDSERICNECVRAAERAGNATTAARGLINLAISRRHEGHVLEARNTAARALEKERTGPLRDRVNLARYLHNLANLDSDLGRLSESEAEFRQAIEILRETGNQLSLMRSLSALGLVLMDRGALREAEAALDEAGRLARSVGSPVERGIQLWRRGEVATLEGDLPAARSWYAKAALEMESVRTQDILGPFRVSRKQLAEPSERACRALENSFPELARTGGSALTQLSVAISRCWSEAGSPRRARRWLDRSAPEVDASQLPTIRVDFALARAAVAYGAGRWSEAQLILEEAAALCRETSLGSQLMEVRLLEARVAWKRGDHPERVRTLAEELERDATAGRFGKIAREAGEILRAPRQGRR